ncbi:MAG: hypothetical protein JWR61_954 [Ferruginibacter sp.]|uniref:MbnP family protein n=1 Tax=Ferruginibacter sp. TaxID=1940288 RepID=UPI0026584F29|nr:MbnP family protein [Ferruginibacter sp.]MDB5275999.1 hypothetical protein [Ferruginibacter sp.]
MMKPALCLLIFFCVIFLLPPATVNAQQQPNIKISFINYAGNQPLVPDSLYANCWKENYSVSRLKYYISNIALQTSNQKWNAEQNSYHLVDEPDSLSKNFSFYLPPGNYTTLSFLIGVDSLKNVSGAQTGALDPLNSMFWTWNSGYIMFKMEGTSPQSAAVNNKIEYHIGGFSGVDNAVKKIRLQLAGTPVAVNNKSITEIIIRANIDKLWNAATVLKITETPVCTIPGPLAGSIAANFSTMFDVLKIVQR